MSFWYRLAEKVRKGEPVPFPLAGVLSAGTVVQRYGMWRRRRMRRTRVDARVISFGNITAGGTGKTPAVIERAEVEMASGKRVAVLTRGYGSQHRGSVTLVDTAKRKGKGEGEWLGDEPELIARRVPGVVLAKASNRVAAAKRAIEECGCDTLILDDGFQYLPLERDENILVVDATNPFGNGRLVPRGILREPLQAVARATHIIVTRCDQVESVEPVIEALRELAPGRPIRLTLHEPRAVWRVCDGRRIRMNDMRNKDVRAVCGIGNPEAFFETVRKLGARPVERLAFPDHSFFPPDALVSDIWVVTTEKDAIRQRFARDNVFAVLVELRDFEPEDRA